MRKPALLAALLLSAAVLAAAPPQRRFNYQGQLTNSAGVPTNTPQNMAFALYTTPSGGSPVAGGSWVINNVPVTRGLFNVELDLPTLSAAQLDAGLWLEVTVGGVAMTPRKQILAGVQSYNSDYLQGLKPGTSPGDIPVILTSTGKLDPAILSSPFPLSVSGGGTAVAGYFFNADAGFGHYAVQGQASTAGLQGQTTSLDGTGVLGQSGYALGGDSSQGTGVMGIATNGVGVRGQANAAGTTAIQGLNPLGLAVFGNGLVGAQFGGSSIGVQIGGTGVGGQSPATPPIGLIVTSSYKGIVIDHHGSGPGLSSDNDGTGVSIEGINRSASGIGLRGEHAGLGFGTGVYGLSNAAGGTGVRGESGGSNGPGTGVEGSSGSPAGAGVRGSAPALGVDGLATAGTGAAYGVRGSSSSTDGTGVQGTAGGGAAAYGVRGTADSSVNGAGVRGDGLRIGVMGEGSAIDDAATGVRGRAYSYGVLGASLRTSGSLGAGVAGSSASPQGVAVRGDATAGGSGASIGVRGESAASQGLGVYGLGTAAGVKGELKAGNGSAVLGDGGISGSGTDRSGVQGTLALGTGERGYGVYGTVTGTDGDGYGVYAYANNSNHRALRAYNTAALGGDLGYALGVEGKFKIGTKNADLYSTPDALAHSSWDVSTTYVGPGDIILVFPAVDISGLGVANSLYVDPSEVVLGKFTVRSHAPVAGLKFYYLVIDK